MIGCVQVLSEHGEWMLVPALQLHKCLMGLSRACAWDSNLAALRPALEISPLERAVCIGQQAFLQAKAQIDIIDPNRTDPSSVSGLRGWLRQTKELVHSIMPLRSAAC